MFNAFLAKCKRRGIQESTFRKYKTLTRQFRAYCDGKGYVSTGPLQVGDGEFFYATWKDGARTAGRKLERFRRMVKFWKTQGWLKHDLCAFDIETPIGANEPADQFMEPFAGVTLATGTGPTSQPFTPTNSLNGFNMGFAYASFLLGDFTSVTQTPLEDYREGHMAWAWFLQDTWKATRKLTFTYGVRYDISTPVEEEHGRAWVSSTQPCRIPTPVDTSVRSSTLMPVTNSYVYPAPGVALGATGNIPTDPDRNFNRPPRQDQWSIGIQREITSNFLLEAAYVANRDVWLSQTDSSTGTPGFLSQLSPAVFAQYGLYPYPGTGPASYTLAQNYSDYQLLLQPI